MKLAIACDHAAYEYKEIISKWLIEQGYEISDFGTYSIESCDYPDFAVKAAKAVSKGDCELGILICGTGIGISITANKVQGIRAANCTSIEMAHLAREHNNANMLAFGSRIVSITLSKEMITEFLATPFAGGRHKLRVDKIHNLTGN